MLSTSYTLIKALKSSQDPPPLSNLTKIQIALDAWSDSSLYLPNRSDLFRDWVLDSWSRGSGCAAYLADSRYHRLYASSNVTAAPLSVCPVDVVYSCVQQPASITKVQLETLQSFPPPDSSSWPGIFEKLVRSLTAQRKTARELWDLVAVRWRPQAPLVTDDILVDFAKAYDGHPYIVDSTRDFLVPWSAPRAARQIAALSEIPSFLPVYVRASVTFVRQHRFQLFSQPTSSRLAYDLFVADQVRSALLGVMQSISRIGVSSNILADVWHEIYLWGGYTDSDPEWASLISRHSLQGTAGDRPALRLLTQLEAIDHVSTALPDDTIIWCLTCSFADRRDAIALLSALCHYHNLARSLPRFIGYLMKLCDTLLADGHLREIYRALATGVLAEPDLMTHLECPGVDLSVASLQDDDVTAARLAMRSHMAIWTGSLRRNVELAARLETVDIVTPWARNLVIAARLRCGSQAVTDSDCFGLITDPSCVDEVALAAVSAICIRMAQRARQSSLTHTDCKNVEVLLDIVASERPGIKEAITCSHTLTFGTCLSPSQRQRFVQCVGELPHRRDPQPPVSAEALELFPDLHNHEISSTPSRTPVPSATSPRSRARTLGHAGAHISLQDLLGHLLEDMCPQNLDRIRHLVEAKPSIMSQALSLKLCEELTRILTSSFATSSISEILALLMVLTRGRPRHLCLSALVNIACSIFPLFSQVPSSRHATAMSRFLTSLSGFREIAKHAPAIITSFARTVADPRLGIANDARKSIMPGLFSICDALTTGGRVNARGREGEALGIPFGLGLGRGGGVEEEVWAELWQGWTSKRYIGQG